MRTFVAVELDDECRERLLDALAALRDAAGGVRWVKPQALHVTLKFIGELKEPDLPDAVRMIQSACEGAEPFRMRVADLSGFPPHGTPRVIHVKAHAPDDALEELHEAVEGALADGLGVKREKRKYIPHITLGRVKKRSACPPLEELRATVPRQEFGTVEVNSIVLMKSDLRPEGAVYTPLQHFPLA